MFSSHIIKESYIWNIAASFLFGFQSVILLMVLTRTVGLAESGIFTIAYANASLFLLIGKYGVRNYQVSDINKDHTFADYRIARMISVAVMIISAVSYIGYNSVRNAYTLEKSMVIFLMCIFKIPDAVEDVYFGEYQRRGRLDIAAKAMTIRMGTAMAAFCVVAALFQDLLIALIFAVLISFLAMFLLLKGTACLFQLGNYFTWKSVWSIIRDCFPIFVGTFLAQYINNAPKYAIDAQLSDELQACYGFIAMPVFVVGLLSNMVFNPLIHTMAEFWRLNKRKEFLRQFYIQAGIILGITLVCIVGAYFIGIPVLSVLYKTNLFKYRNELMILITGGGFLALSGLLNTLITVMRFQYLLCAGYAVASILAFFLSDEVVARYGMIGAAWLYTVLMGMLFIVFIGIFMIGIRAGKKI